MEIEAMIALVREFGSMGILVLAIWKLAPALSDLAKAVDRLNGLEKLVKEHIKNDDKNTQLILSYINTWHASEGRPR